RAGAPRPGLAIPEAASGMSRALSALPGGGEGALPGRPRSRYGRTPCPRRPRCALGWTTAVPSLRNVVSWMYFAPDTGAKYSGALPGSGLPAMRGLLVLVAVNRAVPDSSLF